MGSIRLSQNTPTRYADQALQAVHFSLQNTAAKVSEDISLAIASIIGGDWIRVFGALNPALVEQTLESAVQRAGTQLHPIMAEGAHILHDGISMHGAGGQAEQNI